MDRKESGFTLIELISVVSILAVVTIILTETLIIAVRTTGGTSTRLTNAVATEALTAHLTRDVQSADGVSLTDSTCANQTVLLSLSWSDPEPVLNTASYALEPDTGYEQDIVRWFCTSSAPSTPVRTVLGHFSHALDGPSPIQIACDPTCDGAPRSVTLRVRSQPDIAPDELTVRRRSGSQ